MAVDSEAVRELFKTRLEVIGTTKVAHKYMPPALNDADCPQWLIIPADAEHSATYNTGHRADRVWRLVLLLAKATSRIPYGDLERALDPFFEQVEDEFAAHLRLDSNDDDLVSATLLSDTGAGIVEFPPTSGELWFGCEWQINIKTKRTVTIGV